MVLTYLDGFHACTLGLRLSPVSFGRGFPFLRVLNLGSSLLLWPCAPLDLWRWAFDGLMYLVMGVGGARAHLCHCLSALLCGCVEKLSPPNLTVEVFLRLVMEVLNLVSLESGINWELCLSSLVIIIVSYVTHKHLRDQNLQATPSLGKWFNQ